MTRVVDDHERASRRAANGAGRGRVRSGPEQPQHRLLGLQRQLGNTAVTRILQRTPKDRPASTDAPWAKRRGPTKPKTPPKKLPDIHGRVIKAMIEDGKTVITIGLGSDQGVQVGMIGSLVQENGREVADFTIEKVDGRVSTAPIHTILDEVRRNPNVVIKASKFVPESMEGKEF